MSLEQSILDLTDAVSLLTATLRLNALVVPGEQTDFSSLKFNKDGTVKETKASKRAAVDDVKVIEAAKEAAEAKKPELTLQTTTDTSPSSEPESEEGIKTEFDTPVTYDDVKKATNALSAAKGRDMTIDTLSRFGVKRATELDAGQWADYIAYTEKVIADE